MNAHRLRCGDTVRLAGDDFDIEVAYADYERGYLAWCGWPDGEAEIERAAFVAACSDEEHKAAVARWLVAMPRAGGRRENVERLYRPRAYWRRILERERERHAEQARNIHAVEAELAKAEAGPEDA